jgi:hypothetical protein
MCICNVLYVLVFGQIVVVFRICFINTQTALELVLVQEAISSNSQRHSNTIQAK